VAIRKTVMDSLVSHGLRAQLKTGSLISGSLYVSLAFFPNAPPASLDWAQNPVQLPTESDNIEAMEDSVARLLKNLDQTVTNADKLVGNANQLIEPNSELDAELNSLLLQGNDAARSIRLLADYLERHPEALIRGKTGDSQ
jgi:paraquat-inducible protein B